jgi:hypothetical protein
MHADEDRVRDPHLSILGCATETLFRALTLEDVESGLLPRFAIVWPAGKPAHQPLAAMTEAMVDARATLIDWTRNLHARREGAAVEFEPGALAALDAFGIEIEATISEDEEDGRKTLFARLPHMAVKVAMLAAVGRPAIRNAALGLPMRLRVTDEDVAVALAVVGRWRAFAERFVARIGRSAFERQLDAAARLVKKRGKVPRSVVAQNVHVQKRTLDDIQATLVDRAKIAVVTGPPVVWVWLG